MRTDTITQATVFVSPKASERVLLIIEVGKLLKYIYN